ncbi:MAG: hypothetical protein HKN56_08890 [Gammaproteobacteria bacterium]|nr:hypothetical protein [Gammaproteobacteria bacterium]
MDEQLKNLQPADLDRLGKALITLAQELWVVKDRQRVLEAALAEKGITTSELLDGWEPDAALSATLEKDRAALIDSLLNALEQR